MTAEQSLLEQKAIQKEVVKDEKTIIGDVTQRFTCDRFDTAFSYGGWSNHKNLS